MSRISLHVSASPSSSSEYSVSSKSSLQSKQPSLTTSQRRSFQLLGRFIHHLCFVSAQCPVRIAKPGCRIIRVIHAATLQQPDAALGNDVIWLSSYNTRRDTVHRVFLRTQDQGTFQLRQDAGRGSAEEGRNRALGRGYRLTGYHNI